MSDKNQKSISAEKKKKLKALRRQDKLNKQRARQREQALKRQQNAKKSAAPHTPNAPRTPRSPNAPQRPARPPQSAPNGQPPRKPQPSAPTQKAARPARPISEQARREARKTAEKRTDTRRNKKRRGGSYALYYVLGAFVLLIVFIILANTVMFKCNKINVKGNTRYSAAEVEKATGIEKGENLLRLSTSKAADKVVEALVYVDEARVKKSFPSSVNVEIIEGEKYFCVIDGGVTAAVSHKGKILEHCEAGKLPVVRGYEPETLEPGKWLSSKSELKTEIPADVFKAAENVGLKDVTAIDVSDKFSVLITVEDRIVLSIGTASDLESKLAVAKEIIENELGPTEYVTLVLTNPEKVPVQNNSLPHQNKPASSSSSSAASSAPADGANEPEPVPDDDPEPVPDDEPEPAPDDDPEPAPDDEPKPAPDDEPEPAPDDEPEPAPDDEPEPAPDDEPEPAPDDEPEPAPDDDPEPAPDDEPEPAPDDEPEPAPDDEPEPPPEDDPEPAVD